MKKVLLGLLLATSVLFAKVDLEKYETQITIGVGSGVKSATYENYVEDKYVAKNIEMESDISNINFSIYKTKDRENYFGAIAYLYSEKNIELSYNVEDDKYYYGKYTDKMEDDDYFRLGLSWKRYFDEYKVGKFNNYVKTTVFINEEIPVNLGIGTSINHFEIELNYTTNLSDKREYVLDKNSYDLETSSNSALSLQISYII